MKISTLQQIAQREILNRKDDLREKKEGEFEKGLRPDGRPIGTYRNYSYARMKQRMNPMAGGKVDLMLTKSFVRAMRVTRSRGNKYTFLNSDKKRQKLMSRYGVDIFGLSQKTFDDFVRDQIVSDFFKTLKQKGRIR